MLNLGLKELNRTNLYYPLKTKSAGTNRSLELWTKGFSALENWLELLLQNKLFCNNLLSDPGLFQTRISTQGAIMDSLFRNSYCGHFSHRDKCTVSMHIYTKEKAWVFYRRMLFFWYITWQNGKADRELSIRSWCNWLRPFIEFINVRYINSLLWLLTC